MEGWTVILQFVMDKDRMRHNSFWHYEIECIWGGGKMKKTSDWEICGTTTYFSCWIAQQWEMKTHRRVFSVSHRPYAVLGLTLDVKAQRSTAGPYCSDWSLKLGCLILGALNSRSSDRLCQQELKVGPLVFRRYAFVFGCFFRAPIILLGASRTFLPTFLVC